MGRVAVKLRGGAVRSGQACCGVGPFHDGGSVGLYLQSMGIPGS